MNEAQWILQVVDSFYQKAKIDILIGYHFRNIPDFETHIPRIAAFWQIQLLGTTDIAIDHPFDMVGLHSQLGIKRGEIGRWLKLFRESMDHSLSLHPEFAELRLTWHERLIFFEGVFLRFLGL